MLVCVQGAASCLFSSCNSHLKGSGRQGMPFPGCPAPHGSIASFSAEPEREHQWEARHWMSPQHPWTTSTSLNKPLQALVGCWLSIGMGLNLPPPPACSQPWAGKDPSFPHGFVLQRGALLLPAHH